MTMRVGDTFEASAWFRGEARKLKADELVKAAFELAAVEHGVTFGPMVWQTLKYGDDGVPEPPGPDHELRYAVATVVHIKATMLAFDITTLSAVELATMRAVTRAAYAKECPDEPAISDAQCDEFISQIAPLTIENMIREAVDSGQMH